jgi:hypothetical protein
MIERMLRGLAAALTVLVVWWLAHGVTAAIAMTNPDAVEQEAHSRVELALVSAFRSPGASLDLVTYWGTAWLFSTLMTLIVAVVLGLVAASVRSRSADRTPIVATAKSALLLGTAVQVFLVGATDVACGSSAAIPWPDWAAVLFVTLIATLGVCFGVRPISRGHRPALTVSSS